MLTPAQMAFVAHIRVAHLATVDALGAPHVVPICFVVEAAPDGATLYMAVDGKPKTTPTGLKRLRNIADNAEACVTVDRYDEDWSRLGWVMLRGRAEILAGGGEHARAQQVLRARYPQLAAMQLDGLPVVAIRIARVTSWGNLATDA